MDPEIQNTEVLDSGVEQQVDTPQFTETEQRAIEMGWRPKGEFHGDEANFIDAPEFIRRGELFDKIDHQGKQLKSAIKALETFKDHYSKVKETEYNRAIADLKAAQKQADRAGEYERADQLEAHIERIESEAEQFKAEQANIQVEQPAQLHPEFVSWQSRNSWYGDQPHMRVFADDYGIKLARTGLSPKEVLVKVEEAVRKEFPNKFRNPNKDKPSEVEGSTGKRSSTKSEDYPLSEQERQIMKTLTSGPNPLLTKEQYIADLKKAKGQ